MNLHVKLFRFGIGLFTITTLLLACARNNYPAPLYLDETSFIPAAADSTQIERNNAEQRAFAIYILSLAPNERAAWVSGAFTEEERKALLDSIQQIRK